jgi:hypothetical protein
VVVQAALITGLGLVGVVGPLVRPVRVRTAGTDIGMGCLITAVAVAVVPTGVLLLRVLMLLLMVVRAVLVQVVRVGVLVLREALILRRVLSAAVGVVVLESAPVVLVVLP